VVSDTLVVDPVTGKARLVVEVDEGPQYRLGEFAIEGASASRRSSWSGCSPRSAVRVLGLPFGRRDEREEGEVFDRVALDAPRSASGRCTATRATSTPGEPTVERVPGDEPVVNVTWAISEQSPFYVNHLHPGEHEHARVGDPRPAVVFPGDVYNEDRLLQSYQSIAALGFFETPMPRRTSFPTRRTDTVDLVVHVQEKQTGIHQLRHRVRWWQLRRAGGISGFLGYSSRTCSARRSRPSCARSTATAAARSGVVHRPGAVRHAQLGERLALPHGRPLLRGFSFGGRRYVRTGGSLRYGFPVPASLAPARSRGTRCRGRTTRRTRRSARRANIFCQPSAIGEHLSGR
jgi:hypothetical protein